jgi:uncharacterized membrane protein
LEFLIVIAAIAVFGVLLSDQRTRTRRLEDRIEMLLKRIDALDARDRPASASFVPITRTTAIVSPPVSGPAPPPAPAPQPPAVSRPLATPIVQRQRQSTEAPKQSASETFEALVGGKLPIWIGGIALVLAGFFLVRYSIEAGLLGPGTRSVLAGLFGLALLAGSELGRRIPRFADDLRVAQALAGAGIASLFGTLYMASELYGLIGPFSAFLLLILVTGAALFLSLRHGPPTAIMGLIGGFAAPYVAGLNDGNLIPVLVYLGLLMAGLFALAIHRGWLWLALATTGGGALWSLALLLTGDTGQIGAVGVFVATAAIVSALFMPRAGGADWRIRLVPMLAGFLQLAFLAPLVSFSLTGWLLYALLSGAMIALAWKDARLTPGVAGALGLVIILLIGAHETEGALATFAVAGSIALFALPGHLLARRADDRRWWSAIAIIGGTAPLLIAMAFDRPPLADAVWGLLALAAAVPCGWLAWQAREDASVAFRPSPGLAGGTGAAMLFAFIAGAYWLPMLWLAALAAAAALAATASGDRIGDRATVTVGLGGLALAALFTPISAYVDILSRSLIGERLHLPLLPPSGSLAVEMALPALLLGGALWTGALRLAGPLRRTLGVIAAAYAGLVLYSLAKLPLGIATDAQFVANGFLERAAITQAIFAVAIGVLIKAPAAWRPAAFGLISIAVARVLWFDLVILNPLWVGQAVGDLPVLNAVAVHFALVGGWLSLASQRFEARKVALSVSLASLAAAGIATAFTIRQVFHGARLDTPEIFRGEHYAYSAAFLLLGGVWLWRGIVTSTGWLRIAGLALLTLVTFKVFLVDASVLEGLLRVLSFLGLGGALIGIGWGYGRFVARTARSV